MDPSRTLALPLDGETESAYRRLLADLGEGAGAFRFRVAPNPCVGAAVLSDGVEIGRGFHERWGRGHAEIQAIAAAEKSGVPRERWDTILITLEPCSTQGKTPPCTEAIRAAGIRRVVVGAQDPDARHRGRGLELLREAGIEVVLLERASPLREVSPHFIPWTGPDRLRRPRPWTIAKWAQTRTGQLSPPENVGEGRWISGPESRSEVQEMRGRVDAIVTGIGTVLADDPSLTVRPPGRMDRPPVRVVLDSELRIRPDARILQPPKGDGEEVGGRVIVICRAGAAPSRHRALLSAGVQVHAIRAGDDGQLPLREVLGWLWDEGMRRVLLEAGPTLLESFFRDELVDQLAVYTGNINGGRGASLAPWLEPRRISGVAHREVGEDALLEAFLAHP